jgi:imidazolonepropionase-like amidohydrolase
MKRISLAIAAIISVILSNSLLADSLLITNAQLFVGDDRKALPKDILIVDGLVDAVAEDLSVAEADTVLDANGRTVTPTLFAGITAAGLSEIGMVYEAVDSRLSDLYTGLMHPEFDVRRAYNPHSTVIPVTRIEGFGYTLLMAAPGDRTISGQGSLVRFDDGFDSFEGKTVVYVNVDGSSGNRLGGSRAAHWMLLESAFQELGTDDEDLTLISAAGKQALRATARNGIFVFRANRASDILQSLTFSETHKLTSVISGGQEAWMVRDALADAGVPVVLNALDNLPGSFDGLGARLDNAALLHEAGVTVLFTSGETHNARKLRQVVGNAIAQGFPYESAMAAMTSLPAEIFGGRPRMIAPGLAADLVIWGGDPFDVNSAADQVILDGQLDPMTSRQTQLLQRYLPVEAGLGRAYINP